MLLNCVGVDSWEFPGLPVNPKGNQSWIFIGRTDAKAETPILWLPDVKNWLTGKEPDAGKDWRQEEKGTTEDEMVGWCHQLNVHEFEQAPRVGDGQGRLVCCSLWGHKDSDMTEWLFIVLNWTDYVQILVGENIFITFDCTFLLKCPFLQFSSFWGILLSHGFHAG